MKKDFLNIDNQLSNDTPIAGSISKEEKPKFNWDEKKIITFDFLLPVINQNFENITEEIVEEEPSIDDILDKISERGIDSLTKRETEILENYGKRKN